MDTTNSPTHTIPPLFNELITHILSFVTNPMYWQNWLLASRIWNQAAQKAFISQIQEIDIELTYTSFIDQPGDTLGLNELLLIIKGPHMRGEGVYLQYHLGNWELLLNILIIILNILMPRFWRYAQKPS